MSDLPRSQLLSLAAVGVLVVVLGALWARGGAPAVGAPVEASTVEVSTVGAHEPVGQGGEETAGRVVVHVAGAVRRPGVYRLPEGTRVDEALREAGGATRRADLDALTLAAEVQDGRQVLVPRRAAGSATSSAAAAAGTAAPAADAPVDLNAATLEQLDALDGIGPVTAAAILAYRDEHGVFGSVDELDAVTGIGPATLEALRDRVTV